MVWSEGSMSLKNPVTPPGIDPRTVAQRLNPYATPGPGIPSRSQKIKTSSVCSRLRLKCDGTRVETRSGLSAKRTSPFISVGASVQSTTGSRGVRISGSNAGNTVFRGSVRVLATHSIRQFPLHFPSRASPCAIRFQLDSTVRECVDQTTALKPKTFFANMKAALHLSSNQYYEMKTNERCITIFFIYFRDFGVFCNMFRPTWTSSSNTSVKGKCGRKLAT
jgi:hypothetical protein